MASEKRPGLIERGSGATKRLALGALAVEAVGITFIPILGGVMTGLIADTALLWGSSAVAERLAKTQRQKG